MHDILKTVYYFKTLVNKLYTMINGPQCNNLNKLK